MLRTLSALLLLSLSAVASAQVYRITDPLDARATHCALYADGVTRGDFPVFPTPSGNICRFDIATQAPGSTIVYTATAVMTDPTWGRNESPKSNPLSVARPSGLSVAPKWALTQPAPASASASAVTSRAGPDQVNATPVPR